MQQTMSTFSRAFVRVGRDALRQRSSPVQQALGIQGSIRYVQACRTYATVFERSKPHVNIGAYKCCDFIERRG